MGPKLRGTPESISGRLADVASGDSVPEIGTPKVWLVLAPLRLVQGLEMFQPFA